MDRLIKDIAKSASRLGACSLAHGATDTKSLVGLFFSAQGLEFCQENAFPPIGIFRRLKKRDIEKHGIFVDAGSVHEIGENVAFVGDTDAEVYCRGTKHIFNIVLAHGAKALIHADSHAVVKVTEIGHCGYTLDIDNTVVLL